MVQPIRDGDHTILGGLTSTLIGGILVVVLSATTAMLSSETPNNWNRQESIESTAKLRRQGKQIYCNINMGSLQ